MRLKHLCRKAIRIHLIDVDPRVHLSEGIPQEGLPVSLTSYLLYGASLDEDVANVDVDNDDDYNVNVIDNDNEDDSDDSDN